MLDFHILVNLPNCGSDFFAEAFVIAKNKNTAFLYLYQRLQEVSSKIDGLNGNNYDINPDPSGVVFNKSVSILTDNAIPGITMLAILDESDGTQKCIAHYE